MAVAKVYKSVPGGGKNGELLATIESPEGFGVRHLQAFILFLCLSIGYSMRAQLSVTMVAMTSPDMTRSQNRSCDNSSNNSVTVVGVNDSDIDCEETHLSPWNVYRTYSWQKPTQEVILFSFFAGYTSMMLPIGIIAQKFGGKIPILVALGANGVLSIVTPWVPIYFGWVGMCICRVLQGMTQAAFYPSIHTMLGKWSPLCERGRLSTYIYTGSQFGTVLAFQIAGVFASSSTFSWPAMFWLCGVASWVCFGLCFWLVSASPEDHPGITAEELAYITKDSFADVGSRRRKTPWKQIITSAPVWGLVVSHAGSAGGFLFILTQMPLYMSRILEVDIKNNGFLSSLPYIAMYFMTLLFGYLADYAANHKIMSIANIRRTANSIGMVVSAGFLVAFSFVNSTLVAVILLVLCLGTHSGVHVGFHINQIDLAPNFAGPIMALGNMVANLSSLLVPVITSNILGNDVENQHKWQILFIIMASYQVLTNLIFVIFVKGEVQTWNFYGDDDDNDLENESHPIQEKEKMEKNL